MVHSSLSKLTSYGRCRSGHTVKRSDTFPMTHQVSIANFAFSPASITISIGDSVVWINNDDMNHTATRNDDPSFDTGLIAPGSQSQAIKFSASSSSLGLEYFCKPHPF